MEVQQNSSNSLDFVYTKKEVKNAKSPNSPLTKSPFIKIKIEGLNLDKSIHSTYNDKIDNINEMNNKNSLSLEPYLKLIFNDTIKQTKSIYHNSPKWAEEFEFEVANNKSDKLLIEIYSKSVTTANTTKNNGVELVNSITEPIFIGFQSIPVKFFEKSGELGKTCYFYLRIINKKPDEYFVKDPRHILNIENHDPTNYLVEESVVKRDRSLGVAIVKITYEYFDFYHLWVLNCSIHSIIQREDKIKNKSNFFYKLYLRRNDNLDWFIEATFEKIEEFRNYMIKYIPEVRDLPFPIKSIFSYFPLIGSFYSDSNNDVLIEKKFILDNFFKGVCLNMKCYKLEEFNKFFTEQI